MWSWSKRKQGTRGSDSGAGLTGTSQSVQGLGSLTGTAKSVTISEDAERQMSGERKSADGGDASALGSFSQTLPGAAVMAMLMLRVWPVCFCGRWSGQTCSGGRHFFYGKARTARLLKILSKAGSDYPSLSKRSRSGSAVRRKDEANARHQGSGQSYVWP